ncbi:membrane protein hoka [Arctopsyche grandis]|uniref:membrane protein hoka n=1 Tax=Arctopsyche grandis TaxID=121162 RepID=UPI00406D6F2C
MAAKRSFLFYLTVILVVISIFVQETEARRKILRGRKTVTKTYARGNAVPAWAVTLMVGIAMIIFGGILYGIMRKVVLGDNSDPGRVTYSPTMTSEP